ncbi:MAG: hypothetical protein WDW38_008683 [Sanguina aurantia]
MLEAMFSGRWEKSLARDSSSHVYLDFDPKCFRILVNWLVDRYQAVSGGGSYHGSGQQDVPPLPQDTGLHAPFIAMLDYLQVPATTRVQSSALFFPDGEEVLLRLDCDTHLLHMYLRSGRKLHAMRVPPTCQNGHLVIVLHRHMDCVRLCEVTDEDCRAVRISV